MSAGYFAARRMKYGFIGLGVLGARLANNLLAAGVDLTVYDLRDQAIQTAAAAGARAGTGVADVAGQVDVFDYLPAVPGSVGPGNGR